MSDATSPRPGQAAFAVGLIGVGSLLVIATAWERIAGLHSLAVQEELSRMAADDPFGGGMDAEAIATTLRVLSLIGGAAAAAAAVLSLQAWQRSRSARIVLSCLAPLLFLGWLGTSGFFEPMVLAGITLLWMPPTRDWYAGRDWVAALQRRMTGPGAGGPARPDPFASPSAPTSSAPPATGEHPDWASAPPPQPSLRHGDVPAYPPLRGAPRPSALVTACIITWIATAVVAGVLAMACLLVLTGDPAVTSAIDDTGRSLAEARTALVVLAAIGVPLSALAAVLALGAMLGRPTWARMALAVCSLVTGMACVVLALLSPPVVVPGIAAFVVAGLLARREVAEWRPPSRR